MANVKIEFWGDASAGRSIEDAIYDMTQKARDFDKFVDKVLVDNGGYILQKLKLRLWNYGTDGQGQPLESESIRGADEQTHLKSVDRYLKWKKRMGFRSKPINARLTGAFWRSMKVFSHRGEMTIKASDPKTDDLIKIYGEDLLTLTNEEQRWVMKTYVDPALIEYLKKPSR
jgi:hypothetical protein